MRRGCRVHYGFKTLGGAGLHGSAYVRWLMIRGTALAVHRVRFVAINFER
ncbi:hypothetical protein ACNKHO_02320 [Shigella flexneri]